MGKESMKPTSGYSSCTARPLKRKVEVQAPKRTGRQL
eukprot:CAMPEP_0115146212 /NCGR_PEP_ID=MMETSP0227-20121206/62562_1 /TAXON_ID=89957 /ORGANISM="Polarella glacialis, Strain CCMP 1383" /LENGTH=36 /DNA_ID= /DNA_START= /DNA_END= /DNA_ORIENTATION=